MSCGSCGTGKSGCSSGGSCSSGGCSTMNITDWLSEVTMPGDAFDVVEIKFKGGRKAYHRNINNLILFTGDPVVIEAAPGHHVGFVSAQGEIVRLQMKKNKIKYTDDLKIIYRIAGTKDIERYEQSKERELPTIYRARTIIQEHNLNMKLSDVEYQADNTKATFFYSADDRVDFRELIKKLASEFKIRVEMRQISLRQEAGRLGGIGSCGRELCCSSWLNEFKSVSTSAARYQNLSLNPSKLSGQCGRLKCCLNFELDTYLDALKHIPEINGAIYTEMGKAYLQKTDIFNRLMWFSYEGDSNWVELTVNRVDEIILMNSKRKKPYSLLENKEKIASEVINNDLKDLDKKLRSKNQIRRKNVKKTPNRKKNNPRN